MKSLFNKPVEPFIDRTRGDSQASVLRAASAAGDWAAVANGLAATSGDLSRREFLVDAVASDTSNLSWVDAWVRQQPESAIARMTWGSCAVQYAWTVRSGALPQDVAPDRMRGFHEWLGHAQTQLNHAAEMDSHDSAAWVGLLWTAVGLGIPHAQAAEFWENAVQRNPSTELAAHAYTTFLSPRWAGSDETMWTFVHRLLVSEQAGSPRWALVPAAHLEQWVAARMAGNAQIHSSRYFGQQSVQDEIRAAYTNYLGSPAKQPSPLESQWRGHFACCFYLMGATAELRREMQQIGPGIQALPWGFLGTARVAYHSVREAAGLR